jgi:hypothetical protein
MESFNRLGIKDEGNSKMYSSLKNDIIGSSIVINEKETHGNPEL